VVDFVRRAMRLTGPAAAVSSACSSSAKAFGSGARMIEAGLLDAVVVGGVDSLCLTTLYGFSSLQLTSPQPCRPFDRDRDGLSIAEGVAFFLLERMPAAPSPDALLLLGIGESSDGYHMSSPHPEGLGARMAMEQALAVADLAPAAIDYINLHGTGTRSNDLVEGRAVHALFGDATRCSSTKGAAGHTLGAAGGVEAAFSAVALREGFMPAGANLRELDPALPLAYLQHNEMRAPARVLSNSFGFGGTNCSLILGRADAR
jgi:3-oxoacyl-[acyl-carrier-protein] synthase-1